MAASTTILEVRGSQRLARRALLSIQGATELRPRLGATWLLVRFGGAFAVAIWLEAEQRAVITVYEDGNDSVPVASVLFARLAAWTGAFEIGRNAADEIHYRFAVA